MNFRPCIVVPVFDHGRAMAALSDRLAAFNLPIFVVDDGSNASTRAILDELAERSKLIRLIRHPENQGKGAAVMSGLRAAHQAGFSHALQIDADGQHDANDIPAFLELAARHPDAVILGRPVFDVSAPRGRRLARYLTHVWVWIETLSLEIRDSMCGFRVYPLDETLQVIDNAAVGRRMNFDTEILVRLSWRGLRMVSLPTQVIYPQGGESRFLLWRDNMLISAMHVRLVFGMLWRLPVLLYRRLSAPPVAAPARPTVAP